MKTSRCVNAITAGFILLALPLSGCLKTRAQVKEDSDSSEARPVPAHVQEVQPQGQYVVDEMKAELTRLNGRIEDLERAQKNGGNGASRDEIKKLEARIVELEQSQADMIEAIKKFQSSPVSAANANEVLERGRQQFEAEQFDAAAASFSAYLKSPGAKKAEEATFLRGESYYNLKQYKKAIVDYSKLTEKYTHSAHMPVALYKIGMSFDALGMKDDAKAFYQELIEKFPKAPEAKRARSKIK